ncbi:MAG: U32 family peptidase [Clostridia bacterium]|nr:U32 family peptidase [Clostridia bacterium]
MRFTVPLQDAGEVAVLKNHGADELYCGYLDDTLRALYGGDATLSRRQGQANVSSPEALKALALEARRAGIPVHLALNARVTAEQMPHLIRIANMWADFGGDGVILQDPELLRRLRAIPTLQFTVSLLAVTVNQSGAAFWRSLGADRIVLPRFLSPGDIRAITAAVPQLTYEAMVMGDQCLFVDGFCRSVHAENFAPAAPGETPSRVVCTYHTSGNAYHLCRDYAEPRPDPCAACLLSELADSGVSIGKLGGRGMPLEMRLRWLDFLREALRSPSPARYRESFGHDCNCYYPGREDAQ